MPSVTPSWYHCDQLTHSQQVKQLESEMMRLRGENKKLRETNKKLEDENVLLKQKLGDLMVKIFKEEEED